jgi:hypothetical protein
VETKIRPVAPDDTVPPEVFASKLVAAIQEAGMTGRTLRESRRLDPGIQTVALVWQYGPDECSSLADECSLRAVYDDPSVKSPWTAPRTGGRYRTSARSCAA